jgi:tRNA dimethylallyltransferase
MWQEGLVEEVSNVLKLGYNRDCRALQGIGYREVLEYLDGIISESGCIQKIQTSHYRYAKRQMTWFKKYLD